jgi:hypothetical protein
MATCRLIYDKTVSGMRGWAGCSTRVRIRPFVAYMHYEYYHIAGAVFQALVYTVHIDILSSIVRFVITMAWILWPAGWISPGRQEHVALLIIRGTAEEVCSLAHVK